MWRKEFSTSSLWKTAWAGTGGKERLILSISLLGLEDLGIQLEQVPCHQQALQEVLSSENLFSWSFLQPEACPLSEHLVRGEQQRWLAPCSRWLRQTLHQGLFKREHLGTVPARVIRQMLCGLWGLAVCPGPAPGEHQLCSVVGLGFWSAVGTLFTLTASHAVSDCAQQELALGNN